MILIILCQWWVNSAPFCSVYLDQNGVCFVREGLYLSSLMLCLPVFVGVFNGGIVKKI